jgi:hypothetical protein
LFFIEWLFAYGNSLLNPALPASVVILSEAEGSAFHGRKQQIPPLRCASVGMTSFESDALSWQLAPVLKLR